MNKRMKGTIAAIGAAVLMAGGGVAALAASPQQQGPDPGGAYTTTGSTATSVPSPQPRPRNVAALGRVLVNRFWNHLVRQDRRAMAALLSPAFQVQRADGSHSRRRKYLGQLPEVAGYTISNRVATYATGALVVRYDVATDEVIGGVPFHTEPAPRLSTFVWSGTHWRMTSHANFNRPS